MNPSFYTSLLVLFFHTVGLAQPGPEVFFPQNLERVNHAISKDPDNDSLRLARIHLFYQEDKSITEYDIDYLYAKFKAGTNTVQLDDFTFYHLYGNCYASSNPRLSLSYYRKAANIQPSEYTYRILFDGHYKLRNTDTALRYYDTLITNYGFPFKKFDDDHLTFNKIDLLNNSPAYNPELAAFYTHLSRIYFNEYREQSLKHDFKKQDYKNNGMLETGFAYQFDLAAYYLRWQKQQEAKNVLAKLEKHIGKNSLGGPAELHKYHRYYFLSGKILELEGKPKEAIRQFLFAADYVHYTDTVWSGALRRKYPKNPDALVLHAQVLYNKQLSDNWQVRDPGKPVLDLFQQAKKMGSSNYKIYLAEADHFLFLKDYQKALNAVDRAIDSSAEQSIAYEKKYTILREAYWNQFIPEEKLEEEAKKCQKQVKPLYENAVTSVPEI